MKNNNSNESRRAAIAPLVKKLEALVADVGDYEPTEEDLLNLDELLNELADHSACDEKTKRWAHRQLANVSTRLDTGDYAAD